MGDLLSVAKECAGASRFVTDHHGVARVYDPACHQQDYALSIETVCADMMRRLRST